MTTLPSGESRITQISVRAGDTLTSIARQLGVPLHLLIEVNGITDPNRLRAGQILRVPAISTDTAEHPAPPHDTPLAAAPLSIDRTRYRLPPSHYMREETRKDLIILHFTAGTTAAGAFATWMAADARVATAYLIDPSGTVYELFDPAYWAYHLGIPGSASQNFRHDRRSIGIEIVNPGPLKERNGDLFWWPGGYTARWCSLQETARYVKLPHRGFQYFAAFTPAQASALAPLTAYLRERFGIPMRLPAASRRAAADPAGYFRDFSGIACHHNFRADKFDVGPAFNWDWVQS